MPKDKITSESRMRENRTFGLMRGREVYRPTLPTLLKETGEILGRRQPTKEAAADEGGAERKELTILSRSDVAAWRENCFKISIPIL